MTATEKLTAVECTSVPLLEVSSGAKFVRERQGREQRRARAHP